MKKNYLLLKFVAGFILLSSMQVKVFGLSQSVRIPDQTEPFSVVFMATPSHDSINAAVGLGKNVNNAWGDFNCILQFATDGTLKVRNNDVYDADSLITYSGGKTYFVQMDVNPKDTSYSVKLRYDGMLIDLATDYKFRQNSAWDTIRYRSVRVTDDPAWGGTPGSEIRIDAFQICSVNIDNPGNYFNYSIPFEPRTETFNFSALAIPSRDSMNAAVGLGGKMVKGWGDFNAIVLFGSDGTIKARNGAEYMADAAMSYKPGGKYYISMDVNIADTSYTVAVTTEDGTRTILASDYKFRQNSPWDTIMYASVRAAYNPAASGIPGDFIAVDFIMPNFKTGDEEAAHSKNISFSKQTGIFEVNVMLTPGFDSLNSAFGLAGKNVSGWGDFNSIIRFNDIENTIDVRNGNDYAADSVVKYSAGKDYYFTLEVNIPDTSYSVKVQVPQSYDEILLAQDYKFRQSSPWDVLNTYTVRNNNGGLYLGVSDFYVKTISQAEKQNGLIAKFWDNIDYEGDPVLDTIYSTLEFDAGAGAVSPSVPLDKAGMLWKGHLLAEYTETYKLFLFHNDGGRLWLNGELIIDNWADGQATDSAEVDLTAGTEYELVVRIYENVGTTRGSLSWSSASVVQEIIPTENLFAVDVTEHNYFIDEEAPSEVTNLDAGVDQGTVTLTWDAATDNVGVTGYTITQDGTDIGAANETEFVVTGLTDGIYTFGVSALDEAGNISGETTVEATVELVGINQLSNVQFRIYPNPVTELLFIEGQGNYRFELYNALGMLVQDGQASGIYELSTTSFSNGIYILSIKQNGSQQYFRIKIHK